MIYIIAWSKSFRMLKAQYNSSSNDSMLQIKQYKFSAVASIWTFNATLENEQYGYHFKRYRVSTQVLFNYKIK